MKNTNMKKNMTVVKFFWAAVFFVYIYMECRHTAEFRRQVRKLEKSEYSERSTNSCGDVSVFLHQKKTKYRYGKKQKIGVIVKNNGRHTYGMSGCSLEIYDKGLWRKVVFTEGKGSAEIRAGLSLKKSMILKPDCEFLILRFEIDHAPFNIPLKKGDYRFLVFVREWDEDYKKYMQKEEQILSATFKIK